MPPSRRPRNLRVLVLVASLAAAVAALGIVALGLSSRGGDEASFNASAIVPTRVAPETTGTTYDGTPVSAPTPGRPAVVTFLFANCPDVCPTIAAVLSTALDDLGDEADDLDVVAISVDPEGDTPEAVGEFLDRFRLRDRMQYLTGTRAELQPIWKQWFVLAQEEGVDASTHSARVVLIDRDGRQVASYAAGIPVPVADMTEDLRTLVGS